MRKKQNTSLAANQQGIVSIIIAVILMLVMSLIVLAMSQNSRQEQAQALDRQLSDQAFYNAETGINDAVSYLASNPTARTRKDTCTPLPGISNIIPDPNRPGDTTNQYSCIQYDKAPKTVVIQNLSTSTPQVIPVQTVDDNGIPRNVETLTISWNDSKDKSGNISAQCSFTSGSANLPPDCGRDNVGYGGLRFELVGVFNNPAVDDREEINKNTLVAFFLPTTIAAQARNVDLADPTIVYPNNSGMIKASDCSNASRAYRCSNNIKGINRSSVYIAVRSLYRPVDVTVSGKDASGFDVRFNDAQIMIDSTGKSRDVLRRLQVRAPANSSTVLYPGFSLQTKDSICKLIEVTKKEGQPPESKNTNSDDDCKITP